MSESKQPEREGDHPLARVNANRFQGIIDQHIAEAQQAGMFDNLPGSGKPLELDDESTTPSEDRAGYRMLKHAGFAQPWIELQKEIRERQVALNSWIERVNQRWPQIGAFEREQILSDHKQRLTELNKLITSYNLSAPPVAGQLPLLQLWRERAKIGV